MAGVRLHFSYLLISQVFIITTSSEGDPVNIRGNVVFDKSKKTIYTTFQEPNLSDGIRTLLVDNEVLDSPKDPSTRPRKTFQTYQNTKRVLDTSIQDRVANIQHENVFNQRPVHDGIGKAGGQQSITPEKFVEKNSHTGSVGLMAVGNKMEQPQTKPKTMQSNTSMHYLDHKQQRLPFAQDEPTLLGNGSTSRLKRNNTLLHQMMSRDKSGYKTIKSSHLIFKNTAKHAANAETGKGSRLGGDAKVQALVNKTLTSPNAPEEQIAFMLNKSNKYVQMMDQYKPKHASKVQKPVSPHDRLGLHISAVNDDEPLDEEPTENRNSNEASPITLQDDHRETAPEQSSFATPSQDVSQYGNTIPQVQQYNPGSDSALNDVYYPTRQMDYHQAKDPTEPLDMDGTEDVNEIKDVNFPDTLTQNVPIPLQYKGVDELPPKLYQQMEDSFDRIYDDGSDEYQPQDDFTVTMEPDYGRTFSEDSDYESIEGDNPFKSYTETKRRWIDQKKMS